MAAAAVKPIYYNYEDKADLWKIIEPSVIIDYVSHYGLDYINDKFNKKNIYKNYKIKITKIFVTKIKKIDNIERGNLYIDFQIYNDDDKILDKLHISVHDTKYNQSHITYTIDDKHTGSDIQKYGTHFIDIYFKNDPSTRNKIQVLIYKKELDHVKRLLGHFRIYDNKDSDKEKYKDLYNIFNEIIPKGFGNILTDILKERYFSSAQQRLQKAGEDLRSFIEKNPDINKANPTDLKFIQFKELEKNLETYEKELTRLYESKYIRKYLKYKRKYLELKRNIKKID
jgi:hypothetical protein